MEQASSQATAIFKASLFKGGTCADLTGGLGVDTFFWASSFQKVWYVERNPVLFDAARSNFQTLGCRNIHCVEADAQAFLAETSVHFDFLYLDPARRDDRMGRVFKLEDCTPNVEALRPLFFEKAPSILIKAAPMLDITDGLRVLKHAVQVWVVETGGECRELLFHLRRDAVLPTGEVPCVCVGLHADGGLKYRFEMTLQGEKEAVVEYSAPLRYLYDPPVAVLKAGGFKTFALRYGLKKLHPATNLYTSDEVLKGVPGRCFAVEKVADYSEREVRQALPVAKAHVAVRNFPDTADQMRRRLNVGDGGDYYLFGITQADRKKVVLVTRAMQRGQQADLGN